MEHHIANDTKSKDTFELSILYTLAGLAAGLSFLLLLHWVLRLNSSIATLIETTAHQQFYFWMYVVLTFGTAILLGLHISLLVKRWRTTGNARKSGGISSGFGAIVGMFASACPSCGSILLSAIGITSGLLAFPFAGLELKVLSFLLVAIPLILLVRKTKKEKAACADGTCPEPSMDTFTTSDKKWVAFLGIASVIMLVAGSAIVRGELDNARTPSPAAGLTTNLSADALFTQMTETVIPTEGFQSKIVLGDAIVKLTELGVIDMQKTNGLYAASGGTPQKFVNIATKADNSAIHLTQENAPYYLNALWALGLANHMEANRASPVAGPDLFNFASTGGWTLGTAENGGEYFNAFEIVKLTPEQEAIVQRVAENTYRPCCDNSSFFQDCNHGSALLGLIELGVAQGLDEETLYREALNWNAYWFPQQYIETAMYFKEVESIEWADVDPRLVMSKFYSSSSGWYKNVYLPLKKMNLIPEGQIGGTGC